MSRPETLILGAVAYDPKVVTIWDGFAAYFARHGFAFDYVLYSTYEASVAAHLAGHYHVGWNSPLAWIEAERAAAASGRRASALAMRDSDRDLTSVVLVRADAGIARVADLKGKRVAVGASDSPQATLIPLLHLAEAGIEPERDFAVLRHEVAVGKHGDHVGGERDAAQALIDGRADAACMIDVNQLIFTRDGTLPPDAVRVLTQTGAYDHCNMTVLDDGPMPLLARFRELLLGMSYDDPEVRPLLNMEGLKRWMDGRTSGYPQLNRAVDRFRYLDTWLQTLGAR